MFSAVRAHSQFALALQPVASSPAQTLEPAAQEPRALPQTFRVPPPPQVSGASHPPQSSRLPQPSSIVPQFLPSAAHVVGVQHRFWLSQTSLASGQQLGALPEQKTPLLHAQTPATQSGATSSPTQLWHVAPPVPQTALVSPPWQVCVVPSQQPFGQLIASQTQAEPSQRWPASHDAHISPPVPQAPSLVPRLQASSAQQPVGQLVASQTHAPLTQRCPAAHATSHDPQCWLSVRRSAQPSAQKTAPPGQPVQALFRHCPPQHWLSLSQAIPSLLQAQRALPSAPAAPWRLQHLPQDGE
jgi:hypothetical protein